MGMVRAKGREEMAVVEALKELKRAEAILSSVSEERSLAVRLFP